MPGQWPGATVSPDASRFKKLHLFCYVAKTTRFAVHGKKLEAEQQDTPYGPTEPQGSVSPQSLYYLPMSNFSKVRRVVLLCARCTVRRPAGLLGDGAHTVPPRAANVFSIAWGAPGWGAPLFSFITEQKGTPASAPSPGHK